MVAELLRLRIRLLLNGPRQSASSALTSILGGAAIIVGLAIGASFAAQLGSLDDVIVARIVPVLGATTLALAFLIPAVAGPRELVELPALRGYGISRVLVGVVMLIGTLAGPAIALAGVALLPLLVFTRQASIESALLIAPLILAQALLLVRLGVSTGVGLRRHPRLRFLTGVVLVLVVVVALAVIALSAAPRVIALLPESLRPPALEILAGIGASPLPAVAAWIRESFLAAGWNIPMQPFAPGLVGSGDLAALLVSIVFLGLVWGIVVFRGFRPTWRTQAVRRRGVPGWFRIMPDGEFGGVLARSISYWSRDPRYGTTLLLVPVIPAAILLATWAGGIPWSVSAFFALPVALLMVAWGTLHNDIAYDSTAYWAQVVAHTSGVVDRIARAIPVFVVGLLLLAVGVPATVWLQGDPRSWPIVLGLALAVLLGGIGVSSVSSARSPYPAPHPGESAFAQPEITDEQSVGAQAASLGFLLLTVAPAIVTAVFWGFGLPGDWEWATLGLGAGLGALVLVVGIRSGAIAVERSGPELLAEAMRN